MKVETHLRIALAQLNFTVGDITGNADKIIHYAQHARDVLKADLVVFPELALTGYSPEDLLLRDDFYDAVQVNFKKIQASVTGIYLIFGYPKKTKKKNNQGCSDTFRYNNAALLHDGKLVTEYSKQFLPNYQLFDEKRYFKPGKQSCLFQLHNKTIALFICEDLWQPEAVRAASLQGAELIIAINASPFDQHKALKRESTLRQRCQENHIPLLYVNMVGGQDELIFDGGSLLMDALGSVIARANFFKEALLLLEIPIRPLPPPPPLPSTEALIYDALVLSLQDYVHKNKFERIVLGLSGGIDSALVLAIAVDALGSKNIQALMMPSRYTAEMSIQDAAEMAKIQGIAYEEISIEPLFSSTLNALNSLFFNLKPDSTEENIQARCRGLLLMALANKKNALVLSTSNKSELAVGYATLYGDMVGGFAPLKDIYKTMVYRLVAYRNTLSPVIPNRVITRPPSAELRADQTDLDSLPPYPILDAILQDYIEENKTIDEIIGAGLDAELTRRIITLLYRSEHKRHQAPPGPRITECAFGRDRRYPISCAFIDKID